MTHSRRSTVALAALLAAALLLSGCGGPSDAPPTAAAPAVAQHRAESLSADEATAAAPAVIPVEGLGRPTAVPTETAVPPEVTSAADALATEIAGALAGRAAALYATQTAIAQPTATATRTARPRRVRATDAPDERGDDRDRDDRDRDDDDDEDEDEDDGADVPTDPPPTEPTSLLAALRDGGHVIYLRHTRTNWEHDETDWVEEVLETEDPRLFEDCGRQRQLTGEGRDQARAIGEAFDRLAIPVGRVMSSQWCRTRETAELAFGRVSVAGDRLWDTGYLDDGSSEREHFERTLRELLSARPSGGTNTVLVGHMPQMHDVTGVPLEEGEAAIVRPDSGDYEVVQRVPHGGWDALR